MTPKMYEKADFDFETKFENRQVIWPDGSQMHLRGCSLTGECRVEMFDAKNKEKIIEKSEKGDWNKFNEIAITVQAFVWDMTERFLPKE